MNVEERLDELFIGPAGEFVAGRDELAKELRADGDREQAAQVKKLRRPTVAASLLNRAALAAPAELDAFAVAGRELEEAQRRALDGEEGAAAEWRAAAAREREAAAGVVAAAAELAREAGDPAGERPLELVDETLRAATADPELRERVLRGRLDREQSAATLGTPAGEPPPRREPKGAQRRDRAQARRERERLERELGDAADREQRLAAQVEQTASVLREEKRKLAESKRETAALRRRLKAAERRAGA